MDTLKLQRVRRSSLRVFYVSLPFALVAYFYLVVLGDRGVDVQGFASESSRLFAYKGESPRSYRPMTEREAANRVIAILYEENRALRARLNELEAQRPKPGTRGAAEASELAASRSVQIPRDNTRDLSALRPQAPSSGVPETPQMASSDVSLAGSPYVIPLATPPLSIWGVPPGPLDTREMPTANDQSTQHLMSYAALLTSSVALLTFMSTGAIGWLKERREQQHGRVDLEKKELEITKLRRELAAQPSTTTAAPAAPPAVDPSG